MVVILPAHVRMTSRSSARPPLQYFRLAGKLLEGQATIEEILESQERFDNHFLRSDIWQAA